MTVTPQTNTTLDEIAAVLVERDHYVICGHVSPDGDCIGSQLALYRALRLLGKDVTVLLARDEAFDPNLAFLPGADELIPAVDYVYTPDVFIAVDTPTPDRLGDAKDLHDAADLAITIDHHAVPNAMAQLSYTDPDASATALIIWDLLGRLPITIDEDMASACYTGLMTDTGRFQYQNTDAASFIGAAAMVAAGADASKISMQVYQNRRLASILLEGLAIDHMILAHDGRIVLSWLDEQDFVRCEAQKHDSEPVVDVLRATAGSTVACLLRIGSTEVRGSLRSKDDFDVSQVAVALGGGGHKGAAGFTLHCSRDDAIAQVLALLEPALDQFDGESSGR